MATCITAAGLLAEELAGEPSTNRWGCFSEHEAEECAGEVLHRIHPRIVAASFSTWSKCDLPNEADDDYRTMVRGSKNHCLHVE